MRNFLARTACAVALLVLVGCVNSPPRPEGTASSPPPGEEIAELAQTLVGSPYRYGGADPAGFDCSGLVFFVHHELGIYVPRTAAEQSFAATPVEPGELEPGDIVFFRDPGPRATHVGVYVGEHRFVHAPKSGRPVSYASLEDDYYRAKFLGAGRFYSGP
jgi:cell wall-associated NlpC family hydrolase